MGLYCRRSTEKALYGLTLLGEWEQYLHCDFLRLVNMNTLSNICDIKRENRSESFPQQPSDMLQQEAQRRHSHAGRVPFGFVNAQVCLLLDELQADVTCWGSWTKRVYHECQRHDHGLHLMLAKFSVFPISCVKLAPILHHELRTVFQMSANTRRHPMLLKYCICYRLSLFPHNTTPVSHGITSQTPHTLVRVRVSTCCSVTD